MSKAPDTLDPLGLMNQTVEELQVLRLLLSIGTEKCKPFHQQAIAEMWAERINEAIKDLEFEKQNLPY